ncbi:MAG TPA: hypothetical protein VFM03_02995 [Candidatus Limnocylindria bacterium]|jgi:hypothetical protein|nr:hypothetical protein [Candidatus Limnocylindria bacterium]
MTDQRHPRPTDDDRRFVDTLVFLRGLYAARGPRDTEPVASVTAAMAEAQAALAAGSATAA